MAAVGSILARISSDLEQYLPEKSVLAAFVAAGHEWRERQLGPVRTLHLFILQVLACNTAMAHLHRLGWGRYLLLAAGLIGLLWLPICFRPGVLNVE